jgi:hypothetical protein
MQKFVFFGHQLQTRQESKSTTTRELRARATLMLYIQSTQGKVVLIVRELNKTAKIIMLQGINAYKRNAH